MFCFLTFVEVTCCGIAGIINVKKRNIGSVMWILFIVAGKVLNAFLCTVLTGLQQRELIRNALYKCTFINYCLFSKRCKENYKLLRLEIL
jgi:hypothetical protein